MKITDHTPLTLDPHFRSRVGAGDPAGQGGQGAGWFGAGLVMARTWKHYQLAQDQASGANRGEALRFQHAAMNNPGRPDKMSRYQAECARRVALLWD